MQEHGLSLHAQHPELRYGLNRTYIGCQGSQSESTRAGSWGRVSIVIGHLLPVYYKLVKDHISFSVASQPMWTYAFPLQEVFGAMSRL